jgi:hypothetical protein
MTVIIRLYPSECQKSVTCIASLKFERLHVFGSDKIPLILLVISEGCLNAMTIVIYSGKIMVERPRIKKIITGQLVFLVVFVIAAPPLYW